MSISKRELAMKEMVQEILNGRTILGVEMEGRIEPVVDSFSKELLLKNSPNYEFIQNSISAMGFDMVEIVLEESEIEELKGLLGDYYQQKSEAIEAFANIMANYIREEDMDFLEYSNPVSAGAYLMERNGEISIETDISIDTVLEEQREDIEAMDSSELLAILNHM